ncbi:unnamed protein product [Effrenium voratum]|uniref:Palmitoyltransferase n=1 Tax=Effrenium voratum TaxID=2562239 RepID=A0AA36N8S9_9DINO|nr:unnamed protein product [Effrenium voratum]
MAAEPRRKVVGAACEDAHVGDEEDDRDHARSTAGIAFKRASRDMMRLFDSTVRMGQRVFHVVMRIVGPCLVLLALSLIGFVTYTYFWYGFAEMAKEVGQPGAVAISMVGVFLLTNALYNYAKAVMTSAGIPPEFEAELEACKAPPRKCAKCGKLKPPRAHHCSVCGVCVMKMDHHCPWINNCVGFGNYRYFCLFLLFIASACTFIVVVFGVCFEDVIFTWGRRGTRAFRQSVLISFMICASILCAVCMLGGFHLYLVLTNQTTIEFQINMIRRRQCRRNGEFFRNPYDVGRSRNCQEVFGPNSLWGFRWMFPWMALAPTGDGIKYASIDKMLFLAVVSHEEPPLAVFELLDRIYQVLLRYLGEVSEDSLRQNFSTVYLLLDEMIDSGLPFTTEMNRLESIIAPPSAIGKVVQAVSGSSTQVLSDVPLEAAGQAGPFGALSSALGGLTHSHIGGASAEVWWRRQNVAYGSNEVYVDIVETVSCICNGTGNMISGGVSGEVLINSKLSGVPEVLLSLRNPAVLQNASFHPCVRLPRFQRDKALSFIPPDGEFSLATYWIPDTTMNLPFHFAVSVNYHSDHGKVQISASPKMAITMQNKQMLIDKFVVNIRLPASIASANLACQGGSIRFDDESKVLIWNLGKLASQECKAEGTLNYGTDPKDGTPQIPSEEKPTAQLAFVIKGWAISGVRLDACDVSSINYTPYKASRYTTTAGKIEYRIA